MVSTDKFHSVILKKQKMLPEMKHQGDLGQVFQIHGSITLLSLGLSTHLLGFQLGFGLSSVHIEIVDAVAKFPFV